MVINALHQIMEVRVLTRRALVTGITGQDGAYLAELLSKRNYEVHGKKRRASSINTDRIGHLYQDPHESDLSLILHYGDMTDSTKLHPRYFRPIDVETLLGDTTKAKSVLGWEPETSFGELVEEMIREDVFIAKRDIAFGNDGYQVF